MKKSQTQLRMVILSIVVILNSQVMKAQVIDADSVLKKLITMTFEKEKMFPIEEITELPESDTLMLQSPDKISTDNPNAYVYRLDPRQIKSIFPEIVYSVDDNLIIDYYSLFPIFIEIINNQQKQIEKLKTQLEELKN